MTTEPKPSAEALLPCPFCGCDDHDGGVFPNNNHRYVYWTVRCGNPGCNAEVIGETFSEAKSRWNRRASAPAEYEGYPGIAHDFETAKAQLKAAQYFFESPRSFSQEEFREVGRKVMGAREYTGRLPECVPEKATCDFPNAPAATGDAVRALAEKWKAPPMTLMDEPLIKYAHRMCIEACGAWSAVAKLPIELDQAKCDYAAAQEGYLRGAIDQLYALVMSRSDELEAALSADKASGHE